MVYGIKTHKCLRTGLGCSVWLCDVSVCSCFNRTLYTAHITDLHVQLFAIGFDFHIVHCLQ